MRVDSFRIARLSLSLEIVTVFLNIVGYLLTVAAFIGRIFVKSDYAAASVVRKINRTGRVACPVSRYARVTVTTFTNPALAHLTRIRISRLTWYLASAPDAKDAKLYLDLAPGNL